MPESIGSFLEPWTLVSLNSSGSGVMGEGWRMTYSPNNALFFNLGPVFFNFFAPINSANESGIGRSRFFVTFAATLDSFCFFLTCRILKGETQGVELAYPLYSLCFSSFNGSIYGNLPVSWEFSISFIEFSASTFWEVWSESLFTSLICKLPPAAPTLPLSARRGSIGIITSSNSSAMLWWCKGMGSLYSECS